jgi:hypothetical protein
MSEKDKTRSKLMESMRKTKESANAQSTEKPAQSTAKPQAASKPKSAPKPAAPRQPAAKASAGNYSSRGASGASNYQSGRIWPD